MPKTLPWASPLDYAARHADDAAPWVLFYSGMEGEQGGRYSILGWDMLERIEGSDWDALVARLSTNRGRYDNAWFGYLGYGLKNQLEALPQDAVDSNISPATSLPDMRMMRFGSLLVFDHATCSVSHYGEGDVPVPEPYQPPAITGHEAVFYPTISDAEYVWQVAQLLGYIAEGDLYQANLTRKYITPLRGRQWRSFDLFAALSQASPAPYSAFLHDGDADILSSTPEQFLRISADGRMESRPIKGTRRISANPEEDQRALSESSKDKAENLMILDLVRHDFSRVAEAGSVHVPAMFDVTRYATLWHMHSTITAQKRQDVPVLEAVKACFPPGSMTGAPKIRAMERCSELEQLKRGIYSGAIGWFGGDGSCDLAVVIRTAIIMGERLEYQVGGAIVSDSTPEKELQEIHTKSRAIRQVLGVKNEGETSGQ